MTVDPPIFVHPKALCESDQVGAGTRVWAFAHVMRGAIVGRECNLCDHVFIEAGARLGDRVVVKNGVSIWDRVTIEDDVFVGPNVAFTNDLYPRIEFKSTPEEFLPTRVHRGASIGANATLVCGTTLGVNSFVGAGAVVTQDVAAHALVLGNPARFVAWLCACTKRLSSTLSCECGRRYQQGEGGLLPILD